MINTEQTAAEYFARPDTPMPDSPVGVLMVKVLAKNPGIGFGQARIEAHALLDRAAGRKRFQLPRVLSPAEKAAEKAAMRDRLQSWKSKTAA